MPVAASPLAFDAAEHRYVLDGRPVPSVTQVLRLAGYVDFYRDLTDKIAEGECSEADGVHMLRFRGKRLLEARERGQRVHSAMHFLLEDDLDDTSLDDETRGYLESGRLYLEAHVRQVFRAEMRVYSRRAGYAGTMDLLGIHSDGRVSLWDWKSGDPADVAADLQLAAYLGCLLEMGQSDPELQAQLRATGPVVQRRSVRLFRDGRMARETLYTDPRDFARFLTALSLVHDQARRLPPVLAWDDER